MKERGRVGEGVVGRELAVWSVVFVGYLVGESGGVGVNADSREARLPPGRHAMTVRLRVLG